MCVCACASYKDYFKTVAPSVQPQPSPQQQTFTIPLVRGLNKNVNEVGATIPIGSFVGRGGKITLPSSRTEIQNNRAVEIQNPVNRVSTSRPRKRRPSRIVYHRQRRQRQGDQLKKKNCIQKRVRRILKKYPHISLNIIRQIAGVDDARQRRNMLFNHISIHSTPP